jgi:NTE family protein
MLAPTPHKKRIGLALGSGSARGTVHIGVIQTLKELGVEIDLIAVTSIGALVGACEMCDGIDEFQEWLCQLSTRAALRFIDFKLLASGGVANGNRLMAKLREMFGDHNIEDLPRTFAVVATDVYRGREVWLQEGDLWDAVRASIAVPGLFTPVSTEHHWLSDGALVNPVPVSVCKALGADVIIAVNPNATLLHPGAAPPTLLSAKKPPPNDNENEKETEPHDDSEVSDFRLMGRLSSSLRGFTSPMRDLWGSGSEEHSPGTLNVVLSAINVMQDRITRSRMAGEPADVVLRPNLSNISFMDFTQAPIAIAEGRACVLRNLPALQYALDQEGIPHKITLDRQ